MCETSEAVLTVSKLRGRLIDIENALSPARFPFEVIVFRKKIRGQLLPRIYMHIKNMNVIDPVLASRKVATPAWIEENILPILDDFLLSARRD